MNRVLMVPVFIVMILVVGCGYGPKGSQGFTLPDGDVAMGKVRFVELGCNSCHTTKTVEHLPSAGELDVFLGGKTSRIETYGELVTSVINPSHRLSRKLPASQAPTDGSSPMPSFNDIMSVTDLIHLVAYLQSGYELRVSPRTGYPEYRYYP